MSDGVLEEVVPDAIWVSERPVWFSGVRLRARTTAVRLDDGALLIHSPGVPSDELHAALEPLGAVRWLVVPNMFHHLAAPASAARYPDATLVGPRSAMERSRSLVLDCNLGDAAFRDAVPEFELIPLRGVPFLDETVFFHRPTGSLIGADLLICACVKDHWTWRLAARITGRYGRPGVPPDVKSKTRANDEAARSIDAMLAFEMQRILVAHADTIDDQPAERLAESWRFVGAG